MRRNTSSTSHRVSEREANSVGNRTENLIGALKEFKSNHEEWCLAVLRSPMVFTI